MKPLLDSIGQKLDVGDLVMVVWSDGELEPAKIVSFARKFHVVRGHRQPYLSQATVMIETGSRKPKRSEQMVKVNALAGLDDYGNVVLH